MAEDGTATNAMSDKPQPSRRSATLRFARDVVLVLVAAILVSFLLKTYLVRTFYIPSPSMVSTLQVNDRIIVNELVPEVVGIARGDVVVFRDPGGWLAGPARPPAPPIAAALDWLGSLIGLTASDSEEHLIKRVIGLPGDRVTCCDAQGRLTINGVAIEEPYLNVPAGSPASAEEFDVTVPAASLWVMGDNRNFSADSRRHMNAPGGGFVPMSAVVGKAFVISWPASRWAWQVPLLTLPHAQFLLMSATLGDMSGIADDLSRRTGRETSLITGVERPVPLHFEYVTTPVHETVEQVLQSGRSPVYIVHFSQAAAVERAGDRARRRGRRRVDPQSRRSRAHHVRHHARGHRRDRARVRRGVPLGGSPLHGPAARIRRGPARARHPHA
ncbi:MAG: signal peptidase I, partial [Microbacterium sp.]